MDKLQDRVVLITGGSKGIGKALALAFAKEGAKVFLHGRDEKALKETQALVEGLGAQAAYCIADLMDPRAPEAIVEACRAAFGTVDILINNAGYMERSRVESTPYECLDRHLKVNVYAPFFLSQKALPCLKESPVGAIFNLCSIVSTKAYENQAAYSISKHAIYGLTKVLSREAYEDNVRVYAISPGLVSTELAVAARPEVPLSNMTDPDELAEWIIFMATHKNTAIVDEIIVRRPGKKAFE